MLWLIYTATSSYQTLYNVLDARRQLFVNRVPDSTKFVVEVARAPPSERQRTGVWLGAQPVLDAKFPFCGYDNSYGGQPLSLRTLLSGARPVSASSPGHFFSNSTLTRPIRSRTPKLSRSDKGEVLLGGVGALRYVCPPSASVQRQPDGLTIHTNKLFLQVSVVETKTLLWNIIHIGQLAFRAPHQGLESSFCCWTAGQGLAQKECFFKDTGRSRIPRSTSHFSHLVAAAAPLLVRPRLQSTCVYASFVLHLGSSSRWCHAQEHGNPL